TNRYPSSSDRSSLCLALPLLRRPLSMTVLPRPPLQRPSSVAERLTTAVPRMPPLTRVLTNRLHLSTRGRLKPLRRASPHAPAGVLACWSSASCPCPQTSTSVRSAHR